MSHSTRMTRTAHQLAGRGMAALVLLAASTPLQPACRAQEMFPSRPIHLIVPSTAGGTTDIVARALGQALSQRMNASFIVEQRVGGSTNIGMTYVAKAPPDG